MTTSGRNVCPSCGKQRGPTHDQYTQCPDVAAKAVRASSPTGNRPDQITSDDVAARNAAVREQLAVKQPRVITDHDEITAAVLDAPGDTDITVQFADDWREDLTGLIRDPRGYVYPGETGRRATLNFHEFFIDKNFLERNDVTSVTFT